MIGKSKMFASRFNIEQAQHSLFADYVPPTGCYKIFVCSSRCRYPPCFFLQLLRRRSKLKLADSAGRPERWNRQKEQAPADAN